jgi:hypothetical protein
MLVRPSLSLKKSLRALRLDMPWHESGQQIKRDTDVPSQSVTE